MEEIIHRSHTTYMTSGAAPVCGTNMRDTEKRNAKTCDIRWNEWQRKLNIKSHIGINNLYEELSKGMS